MKYTLQYERTRENYNEATYKVVKDETLDNKNGSENQYFWNIQWNLFSNVQTAVAVWLTEGVHAAQCKSVHMKYKYFEIVLTVTKTNFCMPFFPSLYGILIKVSVTHLTTKSYREIENLGWRQGEEESEILLFLVEIQRSVSKSADQEHTCRKWSFYKCVAIASGMRCWRWRWCSWSQVVTVFGLQVVRIKWIFSTGKKELLKK